jgi:translation elongation factor EF-4
MLCTLLLIGRLLMLINCRFVGQVGYVVTGMRSTREAHIGDTFFHTGTVVTPMPGFKPAKPMVFAGLYPADAGEYERLKDAIDKLTLNDASVIVQRESSIALGLGYRCGFLGLLHMDVFLQRLQQVCIGMVYNRLKIHL